LKIFKEWLPITAAIVITVIEVLVFTYSTHTLPLIEGPAATASDSRADFGSDE